MQPYPGRKPNDARFIVGLAKGVSNCSRTDVGVHFSSVQSLNELPKAFLVAVHLPVPTNKEFPAHGCGGRRTCLKMIKTNDRIPSLGRKSDRMTAARSIYEQRLVRPPPAQFHWLMAIRPQYVSPFQEVQHQKVMLPSSTACKTQAQQTAFQVLC